MADKTKKQISLDLDFHTTYIEPNRQGDEPAVETVRRLVKKGVECEGSNIELQTTPMNVFTNTKPENRATIAEKLDLQLVKGRLNSYEMSVQELTNATLNLTGQTLNELVNEALTYYCQRQLSIALGNAGENGRNSKNTTHGVVGAADVRIKASYEAMIEGGETVTASKLAKMAATNYNTAKRFLDKIGHQ